MVNLNSEYPCSQTSRSRLAATRDWRPTIRSVKSRARVTMGHVGSLAQATFPPPCMSRTWLALRGEPLSHWVATDDSWSKWRPWACPVLRDVQSPPQPLILFTDGSTGAGWGEPSGCSVVVTLQGLVVNSFSFPCGASGNNFLAEIIALLAAILAAPANWDIEIQTDSLSSKYTRWTNTGCWTGLLLRSMLSPSEREPSVLPGRS